MVLRSTNDQVIFGRTVVSSLSPPSVFRPDSVAVTVIFRSRLFLHRNRARSNVSGVILFSLANAKKQSHLSVFCCSSVVVFENPRQSYEATVTVSQLCTAASLCVLVLALGYLDFLFILKLMHDLF